MVSRRQVVLAVSACSLLAPLALLAQSAKIPRIGLLMLAAKCPAPSDLVGSLASLGWIEGRTISYDCVSLVGHSTGEIPSFVAQLVARKPDLIVSGAVPAIRALKAATSTIPIVAVQLADPVEQGFIKSLSHPGGNITGLVSVMFDVEAKRLQLLKEILPSLSRLAVIYRKTGDPVYQASVEKMLASTSKTLGFKYEWIYHGALEDIPQLIDEMAPKRFDAIYFPPSPFIRINPRPFVEAALKHRLPTIGQSSELSEAGVLLTYGWDTASVEQRAARLVDKILRGAKPADIPFEQPTKFDLIINMKTAKALGLKIPNSIMVQATKVIE